MKAYELVPKLKYLTLWGQTEDGELEWAGTEENMRRARIESAVMKNIWSTTQTSSTNKR